MSDKSKSLKSVLHKNKKGIQEKHVDIAGNNDFGSITKNMKSDNEDDNQKPKTSTQRMDTSKLEAAKILYFFLPKKSEKSNPSFNDILNLLIDNYVNMALNNRQK